LPDSSRSILNVDVALSSVGLVVARLAAARPVYTSRNNEIQGSLFLSVEDKDTGRSIVQPVHVDNDVVSFRVHVVGTIVVLTYTKVLDTLVVRTFSLTTQTWIERRDITPTYSSTIRLPHDSGVRQIGGIPYVYVVYAHQQSPSIRWRVDRLRVDNLASSISYPITESGNAVSLAISVSDTSDLVLLAASFNSPNRIIKARVDISLTGGLISETNTLSSAPTRLSVHHYDDIRGLLLLGSEPIRTHLFDLSTMSDWPTSRRVTYGVQAASRPWRAGQRWYVLGTTPTNSASVVALAVETHPVPDHTGSPYTNGVPHIHVATCESMSGWRPVTPYLPSAAVSGMVAYVPCAQRAQERVANEEIAVAWGISRIDHDPARISVAHLKQGTLVSGGAPAWFDGTYMFPFGFAHPPTFSLTATSGASNGDVEPGTYSYVLVYEWGDSAGMVHRSVPSEPRTIEVSSVGRVNVSFLPAAVSQKQLPPYLDVVHENGLDVAANLLAANPVGIAVYRTTKFGVQYYRVPLRMGERPMNQPHMNQGWFYDRRPDSGVSTNFGTVPALNTQAQLYTETGELEDVAPPSLVFVTTHANRLVGIGPDLRTVWFSKDSTEDPTVAPGFNEALTVGFDREKVALASLDDKLVVFGRDNIDVIYGAGPSASGAGASWEPRAIQTDAGCIEPRSVVSTPLGIMFLSSRGIELLTRDLGITWIGKAVENTLAQYPEVTSAILVPDEHEVRFTCNSDTAAIVLAFDFVNSIWFTRSYFGITKIVSAAIVGGRYHFLSHEGVVYRETPTNFLDSVSGTTNYVGSEVHLAPISPAGSMGWSRVKDVSVLGTSLTRHRLEISVKRDYAGTWESPYVFGEPVTTPGPLEKCRRTLPHQKCRSIEIRIRDIAPTNPADYGTGEGAMMEALALRVRAKRGVAKTNALEQG
jgi:hypothetical protein